MFNLHSQRWWPDLVRRYTLMVQDLPERSWTILSSAGTPHCWYTTTLCWACYNTIETANIYPNNRLYSTSHCLPQLFEKNMVDVPCCISIEFVEIACISKCMILLFTSVFCLDLYYHKHSREMMHLVRPLKFRQLVWTYSTSTFCPLAAGLYITSIYCDVPGSPCLSETGPVVGPYF